MRFTLLHPDPARGPGLHATDVEADPGTALADLRPALRAVTGYGGWTRERPAVDDAALDDHHLVGQPPLVEGCVLRAGPGPRAATEAAVQLGWHVAVVAGPSCGDLVALPEDVVVTVPPGPGAPAEARSAHDGHRRPRRAGPVLDVRRRGERVRVRAGGRGPWRRWRPGLPRQAGATTLELRHTRADEPPARTEPAGRDRLLDRPATWLTPLVGSVALALALRQPLLALAGLAAPLVALGTAALSRGRRHGPDGDGHPRDPAALAVATARARLAGGAPLVVGQPWDPGGSLAVVGPRDLALPVARAVVLGALGTHLTASLVLHARRPGDWSWGVWAAGGPASPVLVVADDAPDPAALSRWRSSAPATDRLLVLAQEPADVPAWCRARLEVGPRSVLLRIAGDPPRDVPRHAVTAEWALAQVRAASAARALAAVHGGAAVLPPEASLGALDGIPAPHGIVDAWTLPRAGLVAALGVGADGGTLTVDLVGDGPHALVAGTTGAGKSELLTTLVLALALTHPPDRLAVLLVDFKGGAGLGPVAGLPHVLEHVTDLDPAHARRVLAALRAELRRREAVLAAAGVRDLLDLDPAHRGTPPRLLVVVDELRALTEDVPDASAALARIAAQGRALGVHLVLATQRPAGAIGADLRANVALRIALRVTDAADSTDVLDAPDAAAIDPRTPGRAWLRRGSRPLEPLQVARAVPTRATPLVRPARPWPTGTGWSPAAAAPRERVDATGLWVRAAARAARGRPLGARPPWLPELPDRVRTDDVPAGPGLALALADLPDRLSRGAVRWDPADGHLLVLGGPRSGRTTALLTVGVAALDRGWHVHGVGLPATAVDRLRAGDHHGALGSVLETDDARATARLLQVLDAPAPAPTVLLVDRLDLLLESLGRLARGAGADRLTALWRGAVGGTAVAAGAAVDAGAMRHAGAFAQRLVLPLADLTLDALAGVPTTLGGPRRTPGRAVHVHPAGAELCQVALPREPDSTLYPQTRPRSASLAAGPVLVRALPARVPLPATATARTDPLAVPLGPGADDAGVVWVDLSPGLLVVGPPGSGRTTTLSTVAQTLVRAGHRVLRLVGTRVDAGPALPGVRDVAIGDLLTTVQESGAPPVLLVDDLDDLERAHPDLVELLTPATVAGLVAAVTSESAARAFRGALPTLLRRRRTLVLDVDDPQSAELVGPRAPWCVDPRGRPPGRGVLLRGREAVVVQVYAEGS